MLQQVKINIILKNQRNYRYIRRLKNKYNSKFILKPKRYIMSNCPFLRMGIVSLATPEENKLLFGKEAEKKEIHATMNPIKEEEIKEKQLLTSQKSKTIAKIIKVIQMKIIMILFFLPMN